MASELIPTVSKADIIAGLRELGLKAGDGVMVHSSLRSFGHVEGGAQAVIQALMEVLTPEGLLLKPSFNHAHMFEDDPSAIFNPLETPTINGAIPDLFWRLPGVFRSLDPSHAFAAWGKKAQEFTRFHHRTLTLGADSPLGRLLAEDGFGLLLGVDYGANTFHHVVETCVSAPCLGARTEAYPVLLPGGRRVLGRTWGWRESACPITDFVSYRHEMRRFDRRARIGNSLAILFRLQDCFDVIARLLKEGANGFPPCSRCSIRPRRIPQTVPSDWDAEKGTLRPDSLAWTY